MHLLNGGTKIDVRITNRSRLHLEVPIKAKQDISSIVMDDQNVVNIE